MPSDLEKRIGFLVFTVMKRSWRVLAESPPPDALTNGKGHGDIVTGLGRGTGLLMGPRGG